MARRMMEIREQVASMLSADLRRMAAENTKLRQDYIQEVGAVPRSPPPDISVRQDQK